VAAHQNVLVSKDKAKIISERQLDRRATVREMVHASGVVLEVIEIPDESADQGPAVLVLVIAGPRAELVIVPGGAHHGLDCGVKGRLVGVDSVVFNVRLEAMIELNALVDKDTKGKMDAFVSRTKTENDGIVVLAWAFLEKAKGRGVPRELEIWELLGE
jgi:hypothetical protein